MAELGSGGFIPPRWSDVMNVMSLSITTLGAWWSWRAMRQAKTAAKAAKEAADATTQRNQADFRNYIVTVARENLKELEACLEQASWPSASRRADEFADNLIQLSTVDNHGKELLRGAAEELRQWSNTFKRIDLRETKFSPQKWGKFRTAIRSNLDRYFGPYATQQPRGVLENDSK